MPAGTKTTHQAAYLRSFRVPYPKAAVTAKVSQIASELGITLSRLVMPTRDTLTHYDALLEAITSLVEMKKVADRVDQDIRTAKMRLGLRESETPAEMPMDVDEDGRAPDTPGEGRAHSVVSTRSGRSRRQASVDNEIISHPLGAYCHFSTDRDLKRQEIAVRVFC
jgi:DNA methyltransferase 1-associated protein 1